MAAPPDVNNYFIGKGIVTIKEQGQGAFRDIGNVPEFEITPEFETIEHFSSRTGIRTKDLEIVIEKGGTLRMVMEELTAENLALALSSEQDVDTAGNPTLDIFSLNGITAEVMFSGTNEIGQQVDVHLLSVKFLPSSVFNPISDEIGQFEVSGEILAVGGTFGTITIRPQPTG